VTTANLVRAIAAVLLLAALSPVLAAEPDIHVTGAWTRATPGASTNAAVYFTIVNSGTTPDRLVSADSSAATKAELHESMSGMGGMMEMKASGPVELAPDATVIFKPLGRHLMLTGLKQPLSMGAALSLRLHFEKAGAVTVPVEIVAVAGHGSDKLH
jgi:copper(I)-binding protein